MNNNLPSAPPPAKSSYKPILLTLLFSSLLAGGSCFGFLGTFNINRNTPVSTVYAAGFAFCALTFLGSLLWLVIKVLSDIVRGSRETK
jgi:hypothetical protein